MRRIFLNAEQRVSNGSKKPVRKPHSARKVESVGITDVGLSFVNEDQAPSCEYKSADLVLLLFPALLFIVFIAIFVRGYGQVARFNVSQEPGCMALAERSFEAAVELAITYALVGDTKAAECWVRETRARTTKTGEERIAFAVHYCENRSKMTFLRPQRAAVTARGAGWGTVDALPHLAGR